MKLHKNYIVFDTETFGVGPNHGMFSAATYDARTNSLNEVYFKIQQSEVQKASKFSKDLMVKTLKETAKELGDDGLLRLNLNVADVEAVTPDNIDTKIDVWEKVMDANTDRKSYVNAAIKKQNRFKANLVGHNVGFDVNQLNKAADIDFLNATGLNKARLSVHDPFSSYRIISSLAEQGGAVIDTMDLTRLILSMAEKTEGLGVNFHGDYFSGTNLETIAKILDLLPGGQKHASGADVLLTNKYLPHAERMLEELYDFRAGKVKRISNLTKEFLVKFQAESEIQAHRSFLIGDNGIYSFTANALRDGYIETKVDYTTNIPKRVDFTQPELADKDLFIKKMSRVLREDIPNKYDPAVSKSMKRHAETVEGALAEAFDHFGKFRPDEIDDVIYELNTTFTNSFASKIEPIQNVRQRSLGNVSHSISGIRGGDLGFLAGGLILGAVAISGASGGWGVQETKYDPFEDIKKLGKVQKQSRASFSLENPFVLGRKRIEGLHPGGGVNKQNTVLMTDFGSGWQKPLLSKAFQWVKTGIQSTGERFKDYAQRITTVTTGSHGPIHSVGMIRALSDIKQRPLTFKEKLGIFAHDIGYLQTGIKNDTSHPELGAKLVRKFVGDDVYKSMLGHSKGYANSRGMDIDNDWHTADKIWHSYIDERFVKQSLKNEVFGYAPDDEGIDKILEKSWQIRKDSELSRSISVESNEISHGRGTTNIEGLHPGGGVNKENIRNNTPFGSGWRGLFAGKINNSLKSVWGNIEDAKNKLGIKFFDSFEDIAADIVRSVQVTKDNYHKDYNYYLNKISKYAYEGEFANISGLEDGVDRLLIPKNTKLALKNVYGVTEEEHDIALPVIIAHELFETHALKRIKSNVPFGTHASPKVIADEALYAYSRGPESFEFMKKFRMDEIAGVDDEYARRVKIIYSNVEKKGQKIMNRLDPSNPNEKLHGRASDNIEGLHPGGGVNKVMIQSMTDFGSGYRGPVAPVHHQEISPSYNESKDEYKWNVQRASKIGLGEAEMAYQMRYADSGSLGPYVEATASAGTALHALQQSRGYKNALNSNRYYESERLTINRQYGITGHIDEITDQGIGDIKTTSSGVFNAISMSGKPKPMHKQQVMFYMGNEGIDRGYIRYVNRENPKQEKTFFFDYDPMQYKALLRKTQRAQQRVKDEMLGFSLLRYKGAQTASLDTLEEHYAQKETPVEEANSEHYFENVFREEMAYLKTQKRGMPSSGQAYDRINKAGQPDYGLMKTMGLGLQAWNNRIGHHEM